MKRLLAWIGERFSDNFTAPLRVWLVWILLLVLQFCFLYPIL
jgi:hypothetical protein